LEGNHYFPPESLCCQYFEDSPSRTLCPWKGIASYYNVHAGDEIAFYGHVRIEGEPEPKERAQGGLIARLLGTDRA
ncbi:MAG: DUF427 domain-containing protein, partial [Haloechinothrix sp.]